MKTQTQVLKHQNNNGFTAEIETLGGAGNRIFIRHLSGKQIMKIIRDHQKMFSVFKGLALLTGKS